MNSSEYFNKALGAVAPLPTSVTNYQVPIPTSEPATGGNFWSGLTNFFSNVSKAVTTVKPIVNDVQSTINTIKTGQVQTVQPTFTLQPGQPGYVAPAMSTGKKVLIGLGIAGAATLAYYAFKPGESAKK